MTKVGLIGMEMSIIVSDPWEFGTVHGTGPFIAKVLQIGIDQYIPGKELLLLQLKTPLIYQDVTCEYFIASPRLEGGDIKALVAKGDEVYCSLIRIPAERATSKNPFDLSWWRGGIGLIGTLRCSEDLDESSYC
jgi:hypothetical protein